MKAHPHTIPKVVKPRRVAATPYLPLIAVDSDSRSALIERTGEVAGWADLPDLVSTEPPSVWVCPNSSWLLWDLNKALEADELWQYRLTPITRDIISKRNLDGKRRTRTMETCVNYFGFRSPVAKKSGYWHYFLDPVVFSAVSLGDLFTPNRLTGLLGWGRDVREWCQAQNLKITPTAGGLAGQLLKDPRFYPDARRKVPKQTNAKAREVLPGNYYKLLGKEGKRYNAVYLDMAAAHHNAALSTTFPHADGLFARGRFRDTDPTETTVPDGKPWLARGNPSYHRILEDGHGLILAHLSVPEIPDESFPLPYLSTPGRRLAWVYTNELAALQSEYRVSIDGIEAAWVSFKKDPGLNKYAAWAVTELATMTPERKLWAKPTLLAAYGILAARPKRMELGHRTGKGPARAYPAGHGLLPVRVHLGMSEREMVTANVIHRGMIEAETRLRTLLLARTLTGHGCRVLSIYADAIMVESGTQLPLLPAPWAVKSTLTRLHFLNSTAFTAHEMTKLPGITGPERDRLRVLESIRRKR